MDVKLKPVRSSLIKPNLYNGLKLSNRFNALDEMNCSTAEFSKEENPETLRGLFLIGNKNLFTLGKVRRSTNSSGSENVEATFTNKCNKSVDRLKLSNTENQFQVMGDNSEEDIGDSIKRFEILSMNKSDFVKCKTCNYKKRKCVLNPSQCNAANKHCFLCDKLGHFPRSRSCQKRRNVQSKKAQIKKLKGCVSDQKPITKKCLKLIKMRIQELEMQNMRGDIIKLAKKCAKKFENKCDSESDNFQSYCSRKLNKLLNSSQFLMQKKVL